MVSDPMATIAARLTSLAPGAIAVVAMTGPDAQSILRRILRHPRRDEPISFETNRPRLCRIFDVDRLLDDAVVTLIPGARGDVFELSTHGGVRIVQRLLMLLQSQGATIVDAGEFIRLSAADESDPAGIAARLTVECEIDQALLACQSRRLARWLLRQRALLPPFLETIHTLDTSARDEFVARSRVAIRLLQGVTIALVGPPNAGKSTLANRLIGRDRVLTSDIPGTTRDWVSETAFIDGWPVILTDTAGIRETTCSIESEAIRRATAALHHTDLIVVVLDGTLSPERRLIACEEVFHALPANLPRIVVANKADVASFQGSSDDHAEIALSARTGDGISALEQLVIRHFNFQLLDETAPTAICARQLVIFESGAARQPYG